MRPDCAVLAGVALLACARLAFAGACETDTDWSIGVQFGAGRFVGTGSDSNRLGSSATLLAGARLNDYFGVDALASMHAITLRVDGADRHQGDFAALAFAPQLYPLGQRYRLEFNVAPVFGYSSMRGAIESSTTEVTFASRAAVVGVTLGGLWSRWSHYAVGLSATYLKLAADRSCIQVDEATTFCDAFSGLSPHLATVQLAFRYKF